MRHVHLFRPVSARPRGEGHADRVPDTLLQQNRHARRTGDDSFRTHARLREPEMQGIVGAFRQPAIDLYEILHP